MTNDSSAPQKFWSHAADSKVPSTIPGFVDAMRSFIFGILSISYEKCARASVSKCLNLAGGELSTFLAAQGCTVDGDTVVMQANSENQMRPKKFKENIDFTRILGVIQVLSKD